MPLLLLDHSPSLPGWNATSITYLHPVIYANFDEWEGGELHIWDWGFGLPERREGRRGLARGSMACPGRVRGRAAPTRGGEGRHRSTWWGSERGGARLARWAEGQRRCSEAQWGAQDRRGVARCALVLTLACRWGVKCQRTSEWG